MDNYHELIEQLQKNIAYAKHTGQRSAVMHMLIHSPFEISTILNLIQSRKSEHIHAFHLKDNKFCVLYHKPNDPKETAFFAKEIIHTILHEYEINIGIVIFPRGGQEPNELIEHAEDAAQMAAQIQKGSYRFFHPETESAVARLIALEIDMVHALSKHELFLEYQPKVFLQTGKVSGAEALVRWQHPVFGLIGPNEFMKLVEKSDYIFDVGQWILQTALAEYKTWNAPSTFKLSINLAPKQLMSFYIVESILSAIEKNNVDPHCLALEITENEIISNADDHLEKLTMLTKSGISILADDFGTGYSSLSYLKKFPINGIKLDKSFIDDLPNDPVDQAIVKSGIEMARLLNLRVIAEGIENDEQLAILKQFGCSEGQGYLFSKPMRSAQFAKFLKNHE